MKVLLLEDDRDAREALAALLELDGFDVVQAGDVAEFDAAVGALDIDAIIFDLQLYGRFIGRELVMAYQARRSAEGYPPARLICLTGSDNDADPADPLPYPVSRYLQKPAEYIAILAALRARSSV